MAILVNCESLPLGIHNDRPQCHSVTCIQRVYGVAISNSLCCIWKLEIIINFPCTAKMRTLACLYYAHSISLDLQQG